MMLCLKVVKGLLSSCCVGESCFHVITGSARRLLPWLTAALSLISSLRKSKTPDGRTDGRTMEDVGSELNTEMEAGSEEQRSQEEEPSQESGRGAAGHPTRPPALRRSDEGGHATTFALANDHPPAGK